MLAKIRSLVETPEARRIRLADAAEALGAGVLHPSLTPKPARRHLVLAAVIRLWQRGLVERSASGRAFMAECIRSDRGLGWTWWVPGTTFQWCGATAAWVCARAIGLQFLDRKHHWSSCSRLYDDRRRALGIEYATRPGATALPGDVVIVGPEPGTLTRAGKTRRPWGQHITIVVAVDEEGAWCIGGNQVGVGPTGKRFEGVTLTKYRWTRRSAGDLAVMFKIPVPLDGCDVVEAPDGAMSPEVAMSILAPFLGGK